MQPLAPIFIVILAAVIAGCGSDTTVFSQPGGAAPNGGAPPNAASAGGVAGAGTTSQGPGGGNVGGSGGTAPCAPNDTMSCYSGPSGTEGVGNCMAGTTSCTASGWGPCNGEVVPAAEDCMLPGDEDCDGVVLPCATGTPAWSKRFGDSDWEDSWVVAPDSAGNALIGGHFAGSIDFGGPTYTATTSDAFLAKLDAAGNHLWSRQIGGPNAQEIRALAHAPNGDLFLAGLFRQQIDLGGGPITTAQNRSNVFVARLDAAGNHIWSIGAGDPAYNDAPDALAVDGSGNVVVCGGFQGVFDLGGMPLSSTSERQMFVTRLDPTGSATWAKSLGGAGGESCLSVAAAAGGDVLVTGAFVSPGDIGAGLVSGGGGIDVFVTRFDAQGNAVFALPFGDASDQGGTGVAVDGAGNVFAAGKFNGSVDFGGGPLSNGTIYVAKLSPTGAHLASAAYAPAGNLQGAVRLATDLWGSVALCGEFSGALDFGGGTLPWMGGGNDLFIAKLDGSLQHLWSRSAGASGSTSEDCRSIASDATGRSWVTGRFSSNVDFGTGPLSSAGSTDVFVATYDY